jgi:hypothetical protein
MTLAMVRSIVCLIGLAAAGATVACSNDTTAPRTRAVVAPGAQFDGAPVDSLTCRSGYVVIGGRVQCNG